MSRAERYINENTRDDSNIAFDASLGYIDWLTPDQARKAVEIERDELMEKVCRFLDGYAFIPTYVINDLKKAMKDK